MLAGEDSDADVALVPRRLLQARAQAAPEEAAAAAPAPGQAPEPEAECGGNDGGDEVSMLLLPRRQLDCGAPEGYAATGVGIGGFAPATAGAFEKVASFLNYKVADSLNDLIPVEAGASGARLLGPPSSRTFISVARHASSNRDLGKGEADDAIAMLLAGCEDAMTSSLERKIELAQLGVLPALGVLRPIDESGFWLGLPVQAARLVHKFALDKLWADSRLSEADKKSIADKLCDKPKFGKVNMGLHPETLQWSREMR